MSDAENNFDKNNFILDPLNLILPNSYKTLKKRKSFKNKLYEFNIP